MEQPAVNLKELCPEEQWLTKETITVYGKHDEIIVANKTLSIVERLDPGENPTAKAELQTIEAAHEKRTKTPTTFLSR